MFVKLSDGRFLNLSHVVLVPVVDEDETEVSLTMSGGAFYRVSAADTHKIRDALDRNPDVSVRIIKNPSLD